MAAENLIWVWNTVRIVLGGIVFLLAFYTLRHMWFTWQRMFGRQRTLYEAVVLGLYAVLCGT